MVGGWGSTLLNIQSELSTGTAASDGKMEVLDSRSLSTTQAVLFLFVCSFLMQDDHYIYPLLVSRQFGWLGDNSHSIEICNATVGRT